MKNYLFLFGILSLGVVSCSKEKGKALPAGCPNTIFFATEVKPIFDTKCVSCHFAGSGIPGDYTQFSEIKSRTTLIRKRACVDRDMPQAGSPQLTQDEVDKLRCWIDQGAMDN